MGAARIVHNKSVNIADQLYFSVICGLVLLKLMSLWTNSLRSINAVPQSLQPKSVLRNICLCTNFTWAKFSALLLLINMPLTAAHVALSYIGSLEIVFFKFGPFPASFSHFFINIMTQFNIICNHLPSCHAAIPTPLTISSTILLS